MNSKGVGTGTGFIKNRFASCPSGAPEDLYYLSAYQGKHACYNRPFSSRDEEFDSTSGGTHNQAKTAFGGSHDDMNEIKFKA